MPAALGFFAHAGADGGHGFDAGVAAAGDEDGEEVAAVVRVARGGCLLHEIVDAAEEVLCVGEGLEGKGVFFGAGDVVVVRGGAEGEDELRGLDGAAVGEGDEPGVGIDGADLGLDEVDTAGQLGGGDGDVGGADGAAGDLGEHRGVEHVGDAVDQGDPVPAAEARCEGAGGVPAAEAASEDDDVLLLRFVCWLWHVHLDGLVLF